ncbi:hypothetical protein M8998_00170 [Sphingobacterium sp. lm-10]|uniref:hypothetical protein n=1 Tax=Sphingobacterium sp. lm-10 TaxID=2944904 RepID=UPI00201FB6BF|nr:hypothetical protein [Sphingobacterium sp. lm-10]MCL7986347.1 hypothetical protein [Sphingobacterium sp. lm-10]
MKAIKKKYYVPPVIEIHYVIPEDVICASSVNVTPGGTNDSTPSIQDEIKEESALDWDLMD